VKERLTGRQWLIILTASAGAMLEVVDVSITNVALLHIQASLGATLAEVGWVVTGYAMASVVVIPLSGWLTARLGQRRYFLISLLGFTAASLLCGLAPTLPLLVSARLLQGALGGGLMPMAQAILFRSVPRSLQGMAQGVFGLVVLVGPALGPTLGGVLTDGLGWRWVFFINLPLGLLTALLALATFPAEEHPNGDGPRPRIDGVGITLLVVSLASVQVVLEQGRQLDWFAAPLIRQLTVLALVTLPAFVVWELRRPDPAVDLRVLRHPALVAGCLFSFVLGIGLYGTVFVVPLFAQSQLHETATQTGLLMLPGALASGFTMVLLGRLSGRWPPRGLIATGAVLMVLTLLQLGTIGPATGEPSLFWPLMARGMTTVMMFLPLSLVTLGGLPKQDLGAASGLYNLSRQLGGSFGIAGLTVVLDQRLALHRDHLLQHLQRTDPQLQERLVELQRQFSPDQSLAVLADLVQQQAALLAFGDVFRSVAVLFLLALPLLLLMPAPQASPQSRSRLA